MCIINKKVLKNIHKQKKLNRKALTNFCQDLVSQRKYLKYTINIRVIFSNIAPFWELPVSPHALPYSVMESLSKDHIPTFLPFHIPTWKP